jgi:hypothetical protein
MKGDALCFAVSLDRRYTLDLAAAGEDVLGAALADELENIDRHLVIRARNEGHRRETARDRLRERRAASAEQERAHEEQAKARTHAVIVRPGLALPRVR